MRKSRPILLIVVLYIWSTHPTLYLVRTRPALSRDLVIMPPELLHFRNASGLCINKTRVHTKHPLSQLLDRFCIVCVSVHICNFMINFCGAYIAKKS